MNLAATVRAKDDILGQQRAQAIDVAAARGGEEGLGDAAAFILRDRIAGACVLYVLARPCRQLPDGGGLAFDGGRDFVQPDAEHVGDCEARAAASNVSRRNPKWQARREAIIDTSARVFARQGYHATGINELCDANDLGKGALYHYIGSKEGLLAAIHDRVMDEVLQGADRVAEAGGSPPAQLEMLGEELLDVIHRYPDHVWVFLHEFPALTGDNAAQFRSRRREYEAAVEAVFAAGVDAGEFRPLDPRLAARAWLGMHNYTYLWLKPGGRLTAAEVADQFADLFIRGIAE